MAEGTRETTRARGALLLAAIFVLGLVSGGAMFYLGQRSVRVVDRRPLREAGVHGELLRALDLRPEQREQVERLLRERHEQIERWLDETRVEIRALLDPEQQQKFDELHERRERRRGPGGPGRSRRLRSP